MLSQYQETIDPCPPVVQLAWRATSTRSVMELLQLEHFLAVVEERTFHACSRAGVPHAAGGSGAEARKR